MENCCFILVVMIFFFPPWRSRTTRYAANSERTSKPWLCWGEILLQFEWESCFSVPLLLWVRHTEQQRAYKHKYNGSNVLSCGFVLHSIVRISMLYLRLWWEAIWYRGEMLPHTLNISWWVSVNNIFINTSMNIDISWGFKMAVPPHHQLRICHLQMICLF